MKKVDGQCSNPKYKNRKITIDASLRGLRELEVLIHEMTHAGLYDLDEHAVTEMAHDVATLLWRLGYRKNPKAS
jgi:succinate dehydrogenase flavin-adding protein (antitoxin of CptAB toxin-antitoxin module)